MCTLKFSGWDAVHGAAFMEIKHFLIHSKIKSNWKYHLPTKWHDAKFEG